MGARFYLYLDGRTLSKINVDGRLNDFAPEPVKETVPHTVLAGGVVRVVQYGWDKVRIVIERRAETNTSKALFRQQMRNIEDHLQQGLGIGFTTDSDKSVLGVINGTGGSAPSGSSFSVWSNLFSAWESAATLAADDRVVVSGQPPLRVREEGRIGSMGPLTLQEKLTKSFLGQGKVYLRFYGFYPYLVLDPETSGRIYVSERGYHWTATMELVEDVNGLYKLVEAMKAGKGSLSGTTPKVGGFGLDAAAQMGTGGGLLGGDGWADRARRFSREGWALSRGASWGPP